MTIQEKAERIIKDIKKEKRETILYRYLKELQIMITLIFMDLNIIF